MRVIITDNEGIELCNQELDSAIVVGFTPTGKGLFVHNVSNEQVSYSAEILGALSRKRAEEHINNFDI